MNMQSWLLFSSIALVATVTPGPAVLLVASHSIGYGISRTVYTILGNITGLFIMSLLSVLGLGALLIYSSKAFFTLKIIGALYLIYLGVKLWRNGFAGGDSHNSICSGKSASSWKLYSQGLGVALSNPKAIGFTTALFPQFINHQAPLTAQFAILVGTFMSYSFICLFIYAKISATTRTGMRHSRLEKVVSKIFGTLFIGSGIGLVATS